MTELIQDAINVLRNGGVICYPTDTIWGLGCDATNRNAVEKIFSIKKRIDSQSLIILVNSPKMLYNYIKDIPEIAEQLIEISDKPLTIVYPLGIGLPDNVIHSNGSVAVRVVKHRICNEIINKLKKPLISTSANFSGENSPLRFSEINKEILLQCDFVFPKESEGEMTRKPSSIIKLENNGVFRIIRE